MSEMEKEALRAKLRQNGLPFDWFKWMGPYSKKQKAKMLEIALSRTPTNPATPWAAEISLDEKQEIMEIWGSRKKERQ